MSEDRKFGTIEFTSKDEPTREVRFDKLAVSEANELLMVSLITDGQVAKQIRAMVAPGQGKCIANAGGIQVAQANAPSWHYPRTPGRMNVTSDGYFCHIHKLGYSMVHAMLITKMPGFMKVATEAALWNELTHRRFTTPVIREWAKFIEDELRLSGHLTNAYTFNCQCGVLTATTNKIDEIVSEGLQQRLIEIPSSQLVAV